MIQLYSYCVHVVNYMILICLHPVLLTLCCFSANFLNGFDNDFSSDYVTYYRLLHMHIMHCILYYYLAIYIYIPTLYVYGFLIFADSLCDARVSRFGSRLV